MSCKLKFNVKRTAFFAPPTEVNAHLGAHTNTRKHIYIHQAHYFVYNTLYCIHSCPSHENHNKNYSLVKFRRICVNKSFRILNVIRERSAHSEEHTAEEYGTYEKLLYLHIYICMYGVRLYVYVNDTEVVRMRSGCYYGNCWL